MKAYSCWWALSFVAVSCGGQAPATSTEERTALSPWPSAWSADIDWSDVAKDGSRSNVWKGHVTYDWSRRSMRTDVRPTPGATPGPPIGEEGTMLMREEKLYFITKRGTCSLTYAFGAPRPDWLASTFPTRMASAPLPKDQERWSVDLHRFEGLAGCFNYVFDVLRRQPKGFGGNADCGWPAGAYLEYANVEENAAPADSFAIPDHCTAEGVASPEGSKPCLGCHDG